MSQLKALKAAVTLNDLAQLLEYKPTGLSYLLYIATDSSKYRKFEIPKRSGGMRSICAPSEELNLLQRRLANLLQNALEEIYRAMGKDDESNKPDRISHGFRRNRSIATNAYQHKNRRYVFNIDIENFFGSINFGRVRGFFISNRNFQLHSKIATIIAKISCYENSLPQGSPCSPIISNLIGNVLDVHLVQLSKRLGCTYTRYADDLTFSTNKPLFPIQIAYKDNSSDHIWLPGTELCSLINRNGFSVNRKKTYMQYQDSRQEVTGIIVNKKINIKKEYRHTVRAMVHRLFTRGTFHFDKFIEKNGVITLKKEEGKPNQLHGMLGFIDWIDLLNGRRKDKIGFKNWTDRFNTEKIDAKKYELNKKELTYRRFLMYKEFYASPCTVVICEGKTDNVYLTHAIRSLSENYPSLASTDSENKIFIKLRRFRCTENSTGRILGLKGGSPDLKNFIKSFNEDSSKFKAQGMEFPVIILIDNDSGANSVFSIVKEITKKYINKNSNFTHIKNNLYLVPTPIQDGSDKSSIEDFFESSLKKTKLGGKDFDPSNNYNKSTHYGKSDFAYKIVKPKAETIDFSGFKPLLDVFVDVLKYHENHFGCIK